MTKPNGVSAKPKALALGQSMGAKRNNCKDFALIAIPDMSGCPQSAA
jgi:hypothetical protein